MADQPRRTGPMRNCRLRATARGIGIPRADEELVEGMTLVEGTDLGLCCDANGLFGVLFPEHLVFNTSIAPLKELALMASMKKLRPRNLPAKGGQQPFDHDVLSAILCTDSVEIMAVENEEFYFLVGEHAKAAGRSVNQTLIELSGQTPTDRGRVIYGPAIICPAKLFQ